ncbi:hypothetical protein NE237_013410 [Protea cynaroides]|uniref:chitinase n=1 Tax=Protea cynaroides TaxID=273540 RepID=A0A9Q0JYZ1_9MAGN|nr:hypothetical protein NE237_013410 [Protea cynaroides]
MGTPKMVSVTPTIRKTLLVIGLAGILVGLMVESAAGRDKRCGAVYGCSKIYTGNQVGEIVTQEFFDRIINQSDASCPGNGFYTRDAFLEALSSSTEFGMVGSLDDSKREIAAFFAHVTHETGHFCYIEEISGASQDYCYEANIQPYQCVAGKSYHGRGPLQLKWNYNYGAAGYSIGFDGLNSPEIVADNPLISFKTALWYWMNHCHSIIITRKGFGATIETINDANECNGGNPAAVDARVRYYKEYCKQLGVSTGDNLTCKSNPCDPNSSLVYVSILIQ